MHTMQALPPCKLQHITTSGSSLPCLAAVLTFSHLMMRRPQYSPLIYLEPGMLSKGSGAE